MSLASLVKKGAIEAPQISLIYGPPGVGKTSVAAQAEKPIFVGDFDESKALPVDRLPSPKDFDDFMKQLEMIGAEESGYRTLVVDNLSYLEPLVWSKTCKAEEVDSIEKVGGGYAKGYIEALTHWRAMRDALVSVRAKRGMEIILIAHSAVKSFTSPSTQQAYDRFRIDIHEKAANLFYRTCQNVLFANFETFTTLDQRKRVRAFDKGQRFFHTQWSAAFDAKNRLNLPEKVELNWSAMKAQAMPVTAIEELKLDLKELVNSVKDEELKARALQRIEENATNHGGLVAIREKLHLVLKDQ